MLIKKILCNRCGAEVKGEEHPPQLVKQSWKNSGKCTVANGYRNDEKIHFCDECSKHFEEFMKNER